MYKSGTVLLIKLCHCFISITAKNKTQKTTLRNSCYYGICKTRLSKTKYLSLQRNNADRSVASICISSMSNAVVNLNKA